MSKVEQLQEVAIDELLSFFGGPKAVRESKKAVIAVNLAVRSLAAVGRIKATDRARDATQLMVLKHVAADKKQFKKYLEVSMPHLNPSKQIEHKG